MKIKHRKRKIPGTDTKDSFFTMKHLSIMELNALRRALRDGNEHVAVLAYKQSLLEKIEQALRSIGYID